MASLEIHALQKISNSIFDHIINDLKISKIELKENKDFYWEVPDDELYAVKNAQPKLDIGRLSDDWEFLKPLLHEEKQAVSLMLIHLAPLMRYLGTEVGK